MLPLIQSEVVARQWMAPEAIVNFIAVSESTPGPFAVNISTYVGQVKAGPCGAACAMLGVILPSFLIILLVAGFYQRFRKNRAVEGVMRALRPAVIGLIASALISIGRTVLGSALNAGYVPAVVCAAIVVGMAALAFKKTHPIAIIGLSAALGIAAGYTLGL